MHPLFALKDEDTTVMFVALESSKPPTHQDPKSQTSELISSKIMLLIVEKESIPNKTPPNLFERSVMFLK